MRLNFRPCHCASFECAQGWEIEPLWVKPNRLKTNGPDSQREPWPGGTKQPLWFSCTRSQASRWLRLTWFGSLAWLWPNHKSNRGLATQSMPQRHWTLDVSSILAVDHVLSPSHQPTSHQPNNLHLPQVTHTCT